MVHIIVTVTKIANRGNFKSLCSPITHEATSSHEILTLQHIDACFEFNLKHTSHFRFCLCICEYLVFTVQMKMDLGRDI